MKATIAFVLFLVMVFIIEDVKTFYESTQASFFETDIKRNSLIPVQLCLIILFTFSLLKSQIRFPVMFLKFLKTVFRFL